MNLAAYEHLLHLADALRTDGRALLDRADGLEDLAHRLAGVEHIARDPGFPCW